MAGLALDDFDKLPLHKVVYNKLRQSIIDGTLKPGERLIESNLSKQLSISKTPLREALRELAQEGLITHHSRRGITVADYSEKDVEEIFNLRHLLEGYALEKAVSHLKEEDFHHLEELRNALNKHEKAKNYFKVYECDMNFHMFIVERSENQRLLKVWKTIASQIRVLLQMIDYGQKGGTYSTASHTELLQALKSHDTKKALELLDDHMKRSKEDILEKLKSKGS